MKFLEKYCLKTNLTLTVKKYPSIQFCPSTVGSPLYEVFKIGFVGRYNGGKEITLNGR